VEIVFTDSLIWDESMRGFLIFLALVLILLAACAIGLYLYGRSLEKPAGPIEVPAELSDPA
jgi:hypothetical protein